MNHDLCIFTVSKQEVFEKYIHCKTIGVIINRSTAIIQDGNQLTIREDLQLTSTLPSYHAESSVEIYTIPIQNSLAIIVLSQVDCCYFSLLL